MQEIAYLNETFIPLDEAAVPINDRGLLFADGIYEVIVSRKGKLFLTDEHLSRLQGSADAISLELSVSVAEISEIIDRGVKKAGFPESMVYIQITRGTESRRHNYSHNIRANLIMTFRSRPEYAPELFNRGVAILSVPEIRWSWCNIKSTALLPNVMMKQKAVDQGYQEALFVSSEGIIRECTAANIFCVKNETLITPPADQHILNGITRSFILEQANSHNLEHIERDCSFTELCQADEVFITSSTVDLMPVVKVDDIAIGSGRPGPITQVVKNFFPTR
jgi:D-alanine transaminase